MNIESMTLESIINGGAAAYGLGSSSTTSSASSSSLTNGGVGSSSVNSSSLGTSTLLSSTTSTDSISLDDLPASFTSINHLTNHQNHQDSLHHLTSNHFTPSSSSTIITSSSSSNSNPVVTSNSNDQNNNSNFSLDQFDTIDATSCQLLQSYNIIKDEDYGGLLDDDDLVGSLMMGHHDGSMGQDPMGGHSISDHLTPAQFNLLEDCLEHITSSDGMSGVSTAPSSSSSVLTTIPTSSALNHINHNNHTKYDYTLNHHHHHPYDPTTSMTLTSFDADDLSNELNDHLGVTTTSSTSPVVVVNTSNCSSLRQALTLSTATPTTLSNLNSTLNSLQNQITTSSNNSGTATIVATTSNGIVVQPLTCSIVSNGDDLLSPIITTTTPSGVSASTTNSNTGALILKESGKIGDGSLVTVSSNGTTPLPTTKTMTTIATLITVPAVKTPQAKSKVSSNLKSIEGSKTSVASTPTSASNTNNSSPTNNSASNNSTTPGGQSYNDEICRLTVCPLCDNAKSFCSSSSVTRHLRSVHKLNDLLGTRNCYCLLCSRFLEDLGEFFTHLKSEHQLLMKQPGPVTSLYNRHVFKSFDDFLRWKSNELEVNSGCRYERCFTNEYSRSIYFKCAAIRINRITLTGKISTSSKEPIIQEPGCSSSSKKDNCEEKGGCGEKTSVHHQGLAANGDMILESSFDARMYPCTSSIRLVFRYSGIEAIEFPYHLGHKLDSNIRELCLSHATAAPGSTHTTVTTQPHVHTTTTSNSSDKITIITTTTTTPNNGLQIKTEKIPGTVTVVNNLNNQNQAANSTTTTKKQTIAIVPKITTTSTVSIPNPSAASTAPKVNNSKSNKKRLREQQSQQSQTTLQTIQTLQTLVPTLTTTTGTVTPAIIPPGATKMMTIPATQLTAILTSIPAKKIKLDPGSTMGTITINSHGSMISPCTGITSKPITTAVGQLTFTTSPPSSSISSLISSSSNIATIATPSSTTPNNSFASSSLKSPASQPVDPTIIIDNVASDIYVESPSCFAERESMEVDSSSGIKVEPNLSSTTNDQPSMTTLMIKTYQNDESVCIKKEEDSKDSILVTASTPASSSTNPVSVDDDGLVIVPLEKGMQMVEESIRPRKDLLRKRFNELLDSCLTESDIELVEQTVEQLISTNMLQ